MCSGESWLLGCHVLCHFFILWNVSFGNSEPPQICHCILWKFLSRRNLWLCIAGGSRWEDASLQPCCQAWSARERWEARFSPAFSVSYCRALQFPAQQRQAAGTFLYTLLLNTLEVLNLCFRLHYRGGASKLSVVQGNVCALNKIVGMTPIKFFGHYLYLCIGALNIHTSWLIAFYLWGKFWKLWGSLSCNCLEKDEGTLSMDSFLTLLGNPVG